jgi:hypothetical protein
MLRGFAWDCQCSTWGAELAAGTDRDGYVVEAAGGLEDDPKVSDNLADLHRRGAERIDD